jgi:hypothetical protein
MPPPASTTMLPEEATALQLHTLASLLPPMLDSEYALLRDDIRANGQRQAIVIHDGQLLDGRHRVRACVELGIPVRVVTLPPHLSPMDYVLSVNLRRRSVSHSQLAMIACRMVTSTRGAQRNGMTVITQAEAAARVGVSDRYVRDAAWLTENDPELAAQVWAGERALASACRSARMAQRPPLERTEENEPSIAVFPANPALEPAAVPGVAQADIMRAAMAQIGTLDYAEWVRTLTADELRSMLPVAEQFFRQAFDLADEEGLLD